MRKYEFTNEYIIVDGKKLYRVRAIRDIYTQIGIIESGTIGGFIESENNLSHEDGCWVDDDSRVYGNAHVRQNAYVSGIAHVYGRAELCDNAHIYDNAHISEWVSVFGNAHVSGNAHVDGHVQVCDAHVSGNAHVSGDTHVCAGANIYMDADIRSDDDYIVVKGVSGEQTPLTFFLTNKSTIIVDSRWYHGILEEFRDKIKLISDDDLRQEYTDLVTFVKRKFARILKKRS